LTQAHGRHGSENQAIVVVDMVRPDFVDGTATDQSFVTA
jgi:hypothetical protein